MYEVESEIENEIVLAINDNDNDNNNDDDGKNYDDNNDNGKVFQCHVLSQQDVQILSLNIDDDDDDDYNDNNNNNNNSSINNNDDFDNDTFGNDDDDDDLGNDNDENIVIQAATVKTQAITNSNYNINIIRNEITQNMLKNSNNNNTNNNNDGDDLITIPNGMPVVLKVPKIDRHKLGFPNIVGIIHKYLPNFKKYEIKTKHGIINRIFSDRDFEICPNLNVDMENNNDNENNNDTYLSLRKLARLDSINFVGCKCYGKCQNNKCFCFKNKRFCGNLCKHKCSSNICLNIKFAKVIKTRSSSHHNNNSSSSSKK